MHYTLPRRGGILDEGGVQQVTGGVVLCTQHTGTEAVWKLKKAPSLTCKHCLIEHSQVSESHTAKRFRVDGCPNGPSWVEVEYTVDDFMLLGRGGRRLHAPVS